MKTTLATTVALALALAAQAEFKVDRAAMSEKYWSIWNDEVQAKIDADIELNRKADATFEVAAPDGAEVKVEQIGHAFRFGAHIFNYDQLGRDEWNAAYKASYGEGGIFNQATVAPLATTRTPRGSGIRFRAPRQWSIRTGAVPRLRPPSTTSSRAEWRSTATS